jgi:hypothetical protein
MFDDAKYMAKEAVDRNDALAALDQMREEKSVPGWAKPIGVRRGLVIVTAIASIAAPRVTALENPRWFVVYVIALVMLIALARLASRAAPVPPVSRVDLVVLSVLGVLAVMVALSAQTDTNLQAGVTATAGIGVALISAAVATPTLTRLWRSATS